MTWFKKNIILNTYIISKGPDSEIMILKFLLYFLELYITNSIWNNWFRTKTVISSMIEGLQV